MLWKLNQAKIITGAPVEKARVSHFVMVHIKAQLLPLLNTRLTKVSQSIFADVNTRLLNQCVTVPTANYKGA